MLPSQVVFTRVIPLGFEVEIPGPSLLRIADDLSVLCQGRRFVIVKSSTKVGDVFLGLEAFGAKSLVSATLASAIAMTRNISGTETKCRVCLWLNLRG